MSSLARTSHTLRERAPRDTLWTPRPGVEIERIELPPRGRTPGVPPTPGTREYLTCERGHLLLVASAGRWELEPGDVVVFRGDQYHSYSNPATPSRSESGGLATPCVGELGDQLREVLGFCLGDRRLDSTALRSGQLLSLCSV